MKKIASNLLIVSTQLVVGGLFLFMLFSNNVDDNKVVVVKTNNLNKMADSVSELFVADQSENVTEDDTKEVTLVDEAEVARIRAEEEAKKKAEEEEAKRIAEEEEARKKAEEEAARKKAEEEAAARAVMSSNQSVAALQEYARNLVINTYGWSDEDFVALVNLWNKESGWSVTCYNSSSGAYGIPQSLPGNKMASEGSDWEYNGETQIRWGLSYIKGRYGSPSGAWGHFLSHNWY